MTQLIDEPQIVNAEAEHSVIGSILLEGDLIKDCVLQHSHFHIMENKRIFWAMRRLDKKGIPIDITTIADLLESSVEKIGGIEHLLKVAESVPTIRNFKFYESLVLENWRKRHSIQLANDFKKQLVEEDPAEAIQTVISELMKMQEEESADDDGSIKDELLNLYEQLTTQTNEMTGISTGFYELNKITGGFQESDLIIIGARPSMGKTAFALNVAYNAAEKGDIPCIFSLEMPKKQLLKRLASIAGNIDAQKMRNASEDFTDNDWTKFSQALGILNNLDLHIFDKPSVTVNYIWSKVRKVKRENPGKKILVMIDYLQLIMGNASYKGNRLQEISDISRTLKAMARELDVNVVALSQLSRGVEQRQDKRPMMSDLRESGQIEQDADVIGFLYRDEYYYKDSELKGITELIVSKHRNGPTGTVKLGFIKEYGKFINLVKQEEMNFM
ncbi:replicative DNA helicase (plasmid) [Cytobacillus spongiae]|uniref:replicative DNA helicase n=1 Tax=Cytobacillus spongiae TaxID=2901381 RepID=UPI001F260D2F|nr:replicative DNA helicase [Cytobacillus spongiae]UII58102.1 replicative DNA helicase [Cytobacillus spongiae]